MTQIQLQNFRRDNLLVDFLFEHKGRENIVSARDIMKFLNENGYKTSLGNIHLLIRNAIFERHIPICSSNRKGYFWGETKQEMQCAIDELQGRSEELQARIKILKSFIIN